MAAAEEPEVQFAQRLACNETSTRNKALKKLRKYISARSHKPAGGFTDVELLKLWKGLFYCLWMQDKPLLQEDLSHKISTLIHSFQHFDTKLLYFVSFLQTVKREWTGIDGLRMDKFYQLVRFMFRETFELLKRNSWDSGEIGKFLNALATEVLQGGSGAPSGVQLHVLDLYLTELAVVGSEELTADQNLMFIEPFCKTAAKTKDRILFSAICSNVFSAIVDQAPFAIQDLMKELEEAGLKQTPEEEEEEEEKPPAGKNKKHQISKSKEDEDEMLDQEDEDGEMQDDIGPVLQFDYSAVAEKLFEFSSRRSTPGANRHQLYRIVKVLKNLSKGIFPHEDYPEEVSTDEDDDMFATRKKLKRMKRRGLIDADLDDSPAAKKMKKKKTVDKSNEPADAEVRQDKKKKRKKKKKKAEVKNEALNGCAGSQNLQQESSEALKESVPEEPLPSGPTDQSQEEAVVTGASSNGGHPAPRKRRRKKEAASAGEEAAPQTDTGRDDGEKTSTELSELSSQAAGTPAPPSDTPVKPPAKKKKKSLKQTDTEASGQNALLPPTSDAPPAQKKDGGEEEGVGAERRVNGVSSETHPTPQSVTAKRKKKSLKPSQPSSSADRLTVAPEEAPAQPESGTSPRKKKREVSMATEQQDAGHVGAGSSEDPQQVLDLGKAAKRKKRKIPVVIELEADELEAAADRTPQSNDPAQRRTTLNLKKTKKKKSPTPDSGSKKVTFGLKNNKTAEFKKTDRSLLLSPDGSSRVPFDPKQKPKCGVLKSPGVSAGIRRSSAPRPRRRPAAADFF